MALAPRKLRIGPERHGFIYTQLSSSLWKCCRASEAGVSGQKLFLYQAFGYWFAVDAAEAFSTQAEVAAGGRPAFRTSENAIEAGWHTWETNYADTGVSATEWRATGLSCETTEVF
jgi:hypothetical protein